MLFSEWYNKQCIHKNWQSYTNINRGTICAKELPFRVLPFRGVNCGLIPYGRVGHLGHVTWMSRTNFRSPYPRRLHIKFGFDWPSGFGGEDV